MYIHQHLLGKDWIHLDFNVIFTTSIADLIGMVGYGKSNLQGAGDSCGANRRGRNHKINNMGLKWSHLQCLHASEETSTKHCHGEIPQTLSTNISSWGTSMKCLCAKAQSMGNKHKLDICVQLQVYDPWPKQ